jgi:hypothetical protein
MKTQWEDKSSGDNHYHLKRAGIFTLEVYEYNQGWFYRIWDGEPTEDATLIYGSDDNQDNDLAAGGYIRDHIARERAEAYFRKVLNEALEEL